MTTYMLVLHYLIKHGPSGCSDIGTVIPHRSGKQGHCSVNGGGDYAAQMLLGRMRKAGLVEDVPPYEGSTRWDITPAGRKMAALNVRPPA